MVQTKITEEHHQLMSDIASCQITEQETIFNFVPDDKVKLMEELYQLNFVENIGDDNNVNIVLTTQGFEYCVFNDIDVQHIYL